MAGEGSHGAALTSLAAGLDQVSFLGRLPPDQLGKYYRHAVSTIVPSVCFETFGVIIIESFRERTPVIARRLGPFPEIMAQPGVGELFDTSDDLIAAMRRLQHDRPYQEDKAANEYRLYVDRWTESAVLPQYLDIVARAHAGRSGPGGRGSRV
ncbi:MAG: glycosyltransferase [Gemmatimonadaceae bacterium]